MAWQIDKAHTQVTFAIRHMGISFIKGTMLVSDAELELDETNPESSSLRVQLDVNSLATHDANRDGHLKSGDILDAATYPTIEFATKSVRQRDNGEFAVAGDLTIKGVTREVTLEGEYAGPETDPLSGKRKAGFELQGEIDKTDFGVDWNVPLEKGGFMLGNKLTLEIHAQAIEG